jgi:hypothetical protein
MPRKSMQETYFGTERLQINNLYPLLWFYKYLFIQNFVLVNTRFFSCLLNIDIDIAFGF